MRRFPFVLFALPILLLVGACDATESPVDVHDEGLSAADAPLGLARANEDGSCRVRRLRLSRTGRIRDTNCAFLGLGYPAYADVYRFRPDREFPDYDPGTNGLEMFTFTVSTEFLGQYGIKENTTDPFDGALDGGMYFNANTTTAMSLVGTRNRYQFFILGGLNEFGRYEITTTRQGAGDHSCGQVIVLQGEVTFDSGMAIGNVCIQTFGQTTYGVHRRFVQAAPGVTYTLRLDGLSAGFQPALAAYSINGLITASTGALPGGATSREISFSLGPEFILPQDRFVMLLVGTTQPGTYTLSLTES